MNAYSAYILCTAPRSGSTLLCQMLRATGVAGAPGSFFHRTTERGWAEALGLPDTPELTRREQLQHIFSAVLQAGRATSAIAGIRLQGHSLARFKAALAVLEPEAPNDLERLRAVFGSVAFVRLKRADKVAQAVSLLRAEQSGLWHGAPDGTDIERLTPKRASGYNANALRGHIADLDSYERDWDAWFAASGVSPMEIDYDALSGDPVGTLRAVLGFLNLDQARADHVVPGVRKLADVTSAEWAARYRRETGLQGTT